MNVKEMKTMAKIYKLYSIIENERDLRKAKLSLCSYRVLGQMIETLSICKRCITIDTQVMNWLRKNGCKVESDGYGINYIIILA